MFAVNAVQTASFLLFLVGDQIFGLYGKYDPPIILFTILKLFVVVTFLPIEFMTFMYSSQFGNWLFIILNLIVLGVSVQSYMGKITIQKNFKILIGAGMCLSVFWIIIHIYSVVYLNNGI